MRVPDAVCVFCSSNTGVRSSYATAATAVGRAVATAGATLVYGGARVGLMGVVADAALAAGGRVIGVIPRRLVDIEIAHTGLTELLVVDTMHERKAAMAERSDAFVALPGGFGTLEELFEMVTATQVGIHRKPTGLLDVDGYFAGLLAMLDRAVVDGLVRADNREIVQCDTDPAALLDRLASWQPAHAPKWLDPPVA